jgi:ATP-dependent Lhr-like helicase
MSSQVILNQFHPLVRDWFIREFDEPTPPQSLGWPSISAGHNTLILAPTGSGKTLAAFLWAINHLVEQHLSQALPPGVRILYVSPLKALNNDIERNLTVPLEGIRAMATASGVRLPVLRTAVRTGDTPPSKRTSINVHPPDILITTPESLYLMLTTARSRRIFKTVQYLIVDEIHSIASNKRGVHLSISLERLQEIADQEIVRIGLSATQRPLERIAAFLGGQHQRGSTYVPRPVSIVDAGGRKDMDLRVFCPAPDFSLLPQTGIWPLLCEELLQLIRSHATTLIFVNNRRTAERVAASLNLLLSPESDNRGTAPTPGSMQSAMFNLYAVPRPTYAGRTDIPLVQAYHGSMSRHARERMEHDLKEGRLRALVATSSLELGIDIGSIDLVVQIQSPFGIARGLQRVGRSGHLVNATSKGRIFPTHREDLVDSTVAARAILAGEVEPVQIPQNCLDVLAQQIVAMVSAEELDPGKIFNVIRRSYCYRDLPHEQFESVLQMLAGRYAAETFRELRPRISWDKVNKLLRPLPGSARIAVTSGGTITDRGYYGVYLEDGKTKVGEVDEEFVYETRGGDTFILGTNVWRVEAIERDRLTVRPSPGQPARMPFWRGEGISRTKELSDQVSEFRRFMANLLDQPDCLSRLRQEYPIDSRSAWNLQEYFRRQREATGVIPHDRQLLIESFRDEIGDPRIVVHAPFGRRVNGLLGPVLLEHLRRTGVEPQMLYNDNGILFRTSDAEKLPLNFLDGLSESEAQRTALDALYSSPIFGAQFRQNAARALLMPKTHPGKRTPLWLQRLRAGDLLEIVKQFDDFPIIVETMREILNDILDFARFREIVNAIERGTIEVRTITTETPSPFSSSLLLEFIAGYMYEGDQPRSGAKSDRSPVSRETLEQIVDLDSLPTRIHPEALSVVEARLQHTAEGYRSRSPEELMELLLRVGDLSEEEILARCEGDGKTILSSLERDGRAVPISFPEGSRWVAGEEQELYETIRDPSSLRFIITRYFRTHGPVGASRIAHRFGISVHDITAVAEEMARAKVLLSGRFGDSSVAQADQKEWCYRPTLEQLHRQTLTILRHEIVPSPQHRFVRFLLKWHGVQQERNARRSVDLSSTLGQLQALCLYADIWERDILRARIPEISTDQISRFMAAGNGIWTGSASGKIQFIFRGSGALFLQGKMSEAKKDLSESSARILRVLERQGASFLADIRAETKLSLDALNNGIARLFWLGLITNDVFSEVISVKKPRGEEGAQIERIQIVDGRRAPDRGRMMQTVRRALRQVPGWTGRWSLVDIPGVMGGEASPDEIAAAQAQQMLDRYGIIARELHKREELLPWSVIAAHLQRMELRGEIRRGYFVEGFSGMQYALPAAVDMLQGIDSSSTADPCIVLVHSCDPVNPFGAGVEIPNTGNATEGAPRVARQPGSYIAFAGGIPILIVEGYGSRLHIVGQPDQSHLQMALEKFVALLDLSERLRPFREIVVEYCGDMRPAASPVGPLLKHLGFIQDRNQTMRRDAYSS